jgi:hypothetical protein
MRRCLTLTGAAGGLSHSLSHMSNGLPEPALIVPPPRQ